MSKPKLETFLKMQAMKDKIAELSEELNKRQQMLIKKYGEGRFDYEIEETEGHRYVKYELVDNIRKVNEGEDVLLHPRFKPVDMKQTFLKRIPESLK